MPEVVVSRQVCCCLLIPAGATAARWIFQVAQRASDTFLITISRFILDIFGLRSASPPAKVPLRKLVP
jgi:hypothetical protein